MNIDIEMGRRIKERRQECNLTLKDVAVKIGVASSTIMRYENGTISNAKLPVIEAIAKVLDVNPAWICCKSDVKSITASDDIINTEVFGLKINGRSMEPRIFDGDLVIVKRQSDIESGEIGVVDVDGGRTTTKKIIKQDGGILLVGLNSAVYTPKFYPDGEYEIVGKVLEVRGNMDAFIIKK